MRRIWDNSWFCIPVLLFFNLGLALNTFVGYGEEILFFNGLRVEPLNTLFRFITLLGEAWAYMVAMIITAMWHFRFAVMIALMGLIALPIMYVLKDGIGVDRPNTYFEKRGTNAAVIKVPGVVLSGGQTSFPSGHTMSAFALYSLLTLEAGQKHRRWGLLFGLLAILVGVSRIFLVQHFLADVMAGAIVGLLLSWGIFHLNRTAFLRKLDFLEKGYLPKKKAKT